MNVNASFIRKAIYIGAIALLLFPLFVLGQPSTTSKPGGSLARMQRDYDLSQAELGEIDPASESMKLATLGLRGPAAYLLWNQAVEYKKRKNWDALAATLNQITKLQPNFISVWEFQAHNMSYNVSVEFDDYRQRYHWVKKGIDYLIDGTQYNRDEPKLLWNVGWFIGHKIGSSDERLQYRRLFRVDDEFQRRLANYVDVDSADAKGPDHYPDNWLVARLWHETARDAVARGKTLRGKSPLIFNSSWAKSRINHADSIQDEGNLGEAAMEAWRKAGVDLEQFGNMEVPTSWGTLLRLNDLETVAEERDKVKQQLESLEPGLRKMLEEEAYQKRLTDLEREAIETPVEDRTEEQSRLAYFGNSRLVVTDADLVFDERMPVELRDRAKLLLQQLRENDTQLQRIRANRQIVNYDYWQIRCSVEQTKNCSDARRLVFEANQAYNDDADLENARQKFETAWEKWALIFQEHPALMQDETAENLMSSIELYRQILSQLDEKFSIENFALRPLVATQIGVLPEDLDDELFDRALRGENIFGEEDELQEMDEEPDNIQ